MLKLILPMMMMMISFFMFFIFHPLIMSMTILIQTLLMSLFLGLIINTYWFSYILFLIFLGGLLVLFIYISSIASNEMINFSFKYKIIFFLIMIFILFISLLKFLNSYFYNFFINFEMNNIMNLFINMNEMNFNLSKLYNSQTFFLTIMLIIYLFITLIVVIKITNIFFGPLRSFN